ncbi:MAG TPA: hypothetical protein VNN22_15440, partial [Verrucomicrobiae bacterium]|nr:hypothetical protein [Verrucomicrobiae bacterium]
MKTTRNLLLTGIMATFCCSMGNAQSLIYSNFFNGPVQTLNKTAPSKANTLLGGVSNAKWICTYTNNVPDPTNGTILQNGTIATNGGCALLPFTPQPGCVYFMTASIALPSGMPNWVAMGFAQSAPQTNMATGISVRFTDNPPGGYAWMGIRANTAQGVYGGRGTGSSLGNTIVIPAGTTNLTIVLNTIAPIWTVSAYLGGTIAGADVVGGTQMGTNYTYTAGNPPIGFAGIGQTSFAGQNIAGIQWNYWTLSVTQMPSIANSYWVAPKAIGTGDGTSSANAAGCYVSSTFWSDIQNRLQITNVTINLLDGKYTNGTVNLDDMGEPLHQLSLQAVNLYGPVFSSTGNDLIDIVGSQNIKFQGIVFTGPSPYWGINCQPDGLLPCRNLEFSHCQFINLTNVLYGAIGLVNGTRDVTVDSCTFSNLTANNGNHQHMIYASHDIVGVVATNCLFQDCLADYIRFRDNSEYCAVQNCRFISTTIGSSWPFISVELYNDTNSDAAGDEFFGNYFQISSNSFTYNAGNGPGPYSALHFSDTGYSPYSYDCDLTSSQAGQLGSGSVSFQRSFLQTNLGIVAFGLKMFGNTYNSRVAYHMDYLYNTGNAPGNGWSGPAINLDNVPDSSGASLGPMPVIRNGNFDRQGLMLTPQTSSTPNECLFQTWFCNPKYANILWHPGLNGTSNAMRFDKTANQYVYQWIAQPGPTWTMDFLFTIGSGFSGAGTKFRVDIFHDDISGSKVSVGVNNLGQFGIYNGGTFTVVSELGTVSFSQDSNNNGYYNDPGDVLNVYRMRIVGNYAASTPYINLYASDANSPALIHQSLGKMSWVNGTPVSGQSSPETIAFYNYTSSVILDQIAFASSLAGQPPVITNALLNNGQFVISGTNGFAGDNYYLFSSTNLASGKWTLEATNIFDA